MSDFLSLFWKRTAKVKTQTFFSQLLNLPCVWYAETGEVIVTSSASAAAWYSLANGLTSLKGCDDFVLYFKGHVLHHRYLPNISVEIDEYDFDLDPGQHCSLNTELVEDTDRTGSNIQQVSFCWLRGRASSAFWKKQCLQQANIYCERLAHDQHFGHSQRTSVGARERLMQGRKSERCLLWKTSISQTSFDKGVSSQVDVNHLIFDEFSAHCFRNCNATKNRQRDAVFKKPHQFCPKCPRSTFISTLVLPSLLWLDFFLPKKHLFIP